MIPMPEPRNVETTEAEQLHHAPRLMPIRPLPAPMGGEESENGFDARRVVGALKYHWFLFMVLGSLLGGGLGVAAFTLFPAKYTTAALLRVNSNYVGLLGSDANSARSEFLTFVRTQADAIRSENVLRAALRDSKIGNTNILRSVDDPVRWLEDNLLVEFSEHSELVKVSLTGEDPQELADIINAINAAYMKEVVLVDQLKKKSILDTIDRSRATMEERVKSLKIALDMKHKKDLPAAAPAIGVGAVGTQPEESLKIKVGTVEFAHMNEQLRNSEISYKLAEQHLQMLKARRDKIDSQELSGSDVDDYLSKDQDFQLLKQKAERAEKHFKFMKNSYASPTDPNVLDCKEKCDAANVAVEDYKRTKKTELVRQVQSYNRRVYDAEIEKAEADLAVKDTLRKTFKQQLDSTTVPRERDVVVNGTTIHDKSPADYDMDESSLIYAIGTFEDLLKRQNQQSVEIQASKPRVDEWQRASVPIKKEMKKQIVFTGFATLLGFAIVGAFITLYEMKVNRLFGAREIQRDSAINVIGVLPEISGADAIATSADPQRLNADPFMEGIEKVRLTLSRNFLGKRAQSVLITSAAAGEGKTTLAGHLAVSMTRGDRKTILVDANLRQPGMHEHLGLTAGPGVCEILRGESTTEEAVQRTGISNLSFLAAGAWDVSAQQSLSRDRFRRILDKLRQEYDCIIIDSHDLSTVADTYQMGQHCDAVILCARRFVSRKPAVEQAYEKISELGVPHSGVIIMGESA
jgi:capsular exopolysaccharide synthesis family protein